MKLTRLDTTQGIKPLRNTLTRLENVSPAAGGRIRGRKRVDRNRRLFASNPLCVECLKTGRIAAAEEWDHIVPLADGGLDTPDNLQGLCHECHSAKSAAEARARSGK